MKKKLKTLLIMLVLIMPFITANVYAEELPETKLQEPQQEEQENTWTIEKFMGIFKDFSLDMKENETFDVVEDYYDFTKTENLVNEQVNKMLSDNKITLPLTINEEQGTIVINNVHAYLSEDIRKVDISFDRSCNPVDKDYSYCNSLGDALSKTINITYSNSNDYDENIAADIAKKLEKLTYEVDYVEWNQELQPKTNEDVAKSIKVQLNDDSLDVYAYCALGSGETGYVSAGYEVMIYKNGIYYGHTIYYVYGLYNLNVPAYITSENFNDYVVSKIKEKLSNSSDEFDREKAQNITDLKKVNSLGGILGEEDDRLIEDVYTTNDNLFPVKITRQSMVSTANSNITVTEEEIATDNEVYVELQEQVTKNGYKDIVGAFEITTQEEIDGKLALSFTVGEDQNNRKALVLHKKHNGEIEEFSAVVKDGVITIEVTELSPFMIALGDKVEDTTNNADTGTTNIALYGTIAIIALGGMAYTIKKKNN